MRFLVQAVLVFVFNLSLFAQGKVDVLIKNVNIIPVNTNEVLTASNVGIKDGKIVFIGTYKVPKATKVIDGKGKYVMPSLYDMHVHWPKEHAKRFFQLCTAAGIGTIRMIASEPDAISFRKETISNKDLPKQYIGFPVRDNVVISNVTKWMDSVQQQGYDFIKIFSVKNEALFSAIMTDANKRQLIVCGHALPNVKAAKAIASGYRSIEHVGYFDKIKNTTDFDSIAILAKQKNTFICPTIDWDLMAYHAYPKDSFVNRSGYSISYPLYKTQWDTTYENTEKQLGNNKAGYVDYIQKQVKTKLEALRKLHEKKVLIIAGADAEEPFQSPGFSLLDELLQIQKAGLTNYELLKTATINSALFLKEEQTNGSIEIDKNASLILLSKNPLDDIRNLQTVELMIKGNIIIDCKAKLKMIN